AFAEGFGFRFASHDARRRQVLPEVDWAEVDRLAETAAQAAAGYRLERLVAPVPDEVLAELVEVTAAINDAPLGDLTYGDEHFDLARLRDLETACARRGGQLFRVVARDRDTGRAAGHTVVVTNRWHPEHAVQADTAVAREHRGHRLGQLVKIDMMRWLAEVAPQVQMLETWNQADNAYMIQVNEAIGYRLAEVYATYERRLEP
ncbi:MAG: hypothetical protein JWP61_2832, partial [Friedmanniella sp.]|nr:hypothetical protein [Friedmanniella sp.]